MVPASLNVALIILCCHRRWVLVSPLSSIFIYFLRLPFIIVLPIIKGRGIHAWPPHLPVSLSPLPPIIPWGIKDDIYSFYFIVLFFTFGPQPHHLIHRRNFGMNSLYVKGILKNPLSVHSLILNRLSC